MRLKDFFNMRDMIRVALIGSALLLLVGTGYGIFLHAMYTSEVNQVRNDLSYISDLMKTKSSTAYSGGSGDEARAFKDISARATEFSKQIKGPPVTPSSYTYFNHWIASASFTTLTLNPKILGLPDETVAAFQEMDSDILLGKAGWWGREEFYGFDVQIGDYRTFLGEKPTLQTHFWSFYIFVFLISFFTIYISTKEEYELPAIPEIIYGLFMPGLFWLIYSLTAIISLSGIIRFLDASQVDLFVLMLSFLIMSVISAVGGLCASFLRSRKKGRKE